jgi:hypothetical protein
MKARALRVRLGELTGVIIAVIVGALSCGGGGAVPPGGSDAGVDGVDGVGAPVVAAPDLRFKWVGAGFTIKPAGMTNAGTGAGSRTGFHGQGFWSALDLTGTAGGHYFSFSTVENLEMMSGTVTSGALSG